MQSLDQIQSASDPARAVEAQPAGALSSPAARRNIEPIRSVLAAHLPPHAAVLEVASGSGEHALAFAKAFPAVDWLPSDPSDEALVSIRAWRDASGTPNLAPPVQLDAADEATWPDQTFDVMFCANMIHISPWRATEGLMTLAGQRLIRPGGLLALYGPYKEADVELAPSNAAFDESLKARNPEWGLRELDTVASLARDHGLRLTRRMEMPANNLMLLFRTV